MLDIQKNCQREIDRRRHLLIPAFLSLSIFTSQPGLADQIDCEKVRTGTEPIRFTLSNTAETEFKKPPQKTTYNDIVRNSPEGVGAYNYLNEAKIKYVFTKNLIPVSLEFIGKFPPHKFNYDADVSSFVFAPGKSVTFNAVEDWSEHIQVTAHHEMTFSDGGKFSVAGCSFPVMSVHHTIHFKRDTKEWDMTIDSLVSFDLGEVMQSRRQIMADPSIMEPGIIVNVVTDLSTTADMTKPPQ